MPNTPRFWWSPTWGVLQAPHNWTEGMWMQVLSAGPYSPVFIEPPTDARPLDPRPILPPPVAA